MLQQQCYRRDSSADSLHWQHKLQGGAFAIFVNNTSPGKLPSGLVKSYDNPFAQQALLETY